MKLESLYIENFGGLSRYALTLEQGLTVIQAHNGYGKTTLAEFIRAMFYGFPRKGKSLEKSRRQKYTPWQGGKFGGNLVFEFEGIRYRIERTFGATPRGDTFALFDLETGRRSDRFTDQIGLELFGLDGDSFERSTYVPQLREQGELTTDSIQAKLSNLVEDSGDLGNFDRAMAALRSARSGFVPYRGSGGTVAKARAQVSRLQAELSDLTGKEEEERELEQCIGRLEAKLEDIRTRRGAIQARLDAAGAQALIAAAHREYGELLEQERCVAWELNRLRDRYPQGIPEESEIGEAGAIAERCRILRSQPVSDEEERSAVRFLEENRIFETRIPTGEEMEACRSHIIACQSLTARLESSGPSEEKRQRYAHLLHLQHSGALESHRIEELAEANRELEAREREMETVTLSDGDRQKFSELRQYFRAGIPDEAEIRQYQRNLATAEELREQIRTEYPDPGRTEKRIPSLLWPVALLILGLGGIGAGIWFLVGHSLIPGFGALIPGLGLMTVALGLLLRRNRCAEADRKVRAEHWENQRQQGERIAALETEAQAFAGLYTQTQPVSEALREIAVSREDFLRLTCLVTAVARRRSALEEETARMRQRLSRELGRSDFHRGILQLHLAAEQLSELQRELEMAAAVQESLRREMLAHQAAAEDFLRYFSPEAPQQELHILLAELQQRMIRYADARKTAEIRKQQRECTARELARMEVALAEFFSRFGLAQPGDPGQALVRIRDDRRDYEQLLREEEALGRRVLECKERLAKELALPVPETVEDPAALRREDQRLTLMGEDTAEQLLRQRQLLRQLQEQLDRASGVREELGFWQTRHREDQKKAELLDDTMDCLDRARAQLQRSYMGPLREAFFGYMKKLLGEDASKILLTPDFQVHLERCGEVRELGFFSAGQTDLVMLCMRMALVDALFTAEKPFVILDDPFVNLDDEHTAAALELLRELAADRQIIYLVCNSSRNFG